MSIDDQMNAAHKRHIRRMEELAIWSDQLRRQLDHCTQLRHQALANFWKELNEITAQGAYPTGPLEVPELPQSEREKCPLCQAKVGLNLSSPTLAYADSPRTRHLMDVHKRTLDEAQEIIRKHHGR